MSLTALHGVHMILLCSSYVEKMASVVFHFTQLPSNAEGKMFQLTPIMKPTIKLFPKHLKIAHQTFFEKVLPDLVSKLRWESIYSTFRSKHGQNLENSWEIRKTPGFWKFFNKKSRLNLLRFEFWDQIWNPFIKHVWSCYF